MSGAARAGFVGVPMLDTRFPWLPGDIGNPLTFERAGIPVRYAVIAGASPRRIVQQADPTWLQPFVDAARIARCVADHDQLRLSRRLPA